MSDLEKQRQAQEIQQELKAKGLSRRAFLDRLKSLGVGFGASAMLDVRGADAGLRFNTNSDGALSLNSNNPDLNNIIDEGRQQFAQGWGHNPQTSTGYGTTPQPGGQTQSPGGYGGGQTQSPGGYGGSPGQTPYDRY